LAEREQAQVTPVKLLNVRPNREEAKQRPKQRPSASHPWRFFDYSEKSLAARLKRGELCILRR
jgi:hypothetical protein